MIGAMRAQRLSAVDRAAAAFLLLLMGIGALLLWVGVPAGWLWAAGQITAEPAQHILLSLFGVPIAMILWARGLFWVNRLYGRITLGGEVESDPEDEEETEDRHWSRGPLEPMLVGSFLIALVVLFYWFFVLAENPGAWVF